MFRLRPEKPKAALGAIALRSAAVIFVCLGVAAFIVGGLEALKAVRRGAQVPAPASAQAVLRPLSSAQHAIARKESGKRAAIAIVIDDLGQDLPAAQRAMALPRAVVLSFLPFAETTPALSAEAARGGHEVLLHMPMESLSGKNAGPNALKLDLPRAEVERRLAWGLSRVPSAIGLNNHEGSRFTSDAEALVPVVEMLKARGLFFFDSRTAATTQVVSVAQAFSVASAERDVFLDDTVSPDAVTAQLKVLEDKARAQGIAIAIGHPHAVTLEALAVWTKSLEARGFALVPLSEAIRLKTKRALTLTSGR
jgi:polysaccharide deacetylase 2 family uncharacterized protein YibQ